MVDLVLDANCQKTINFEFEGFPLAIQGLNHDLFCTFHVLEKSRNRQTAFLRLLCSLFGNDFRIN
jgi:hypothetical protein